MAATTFDIAMERSLSAAVARPAKDFPQTNSELKEAWPKIIGREGCYSTVGRGGSSGCEGLAARGSAAAAMAILKRPLLKRIVASEIGIRKVVSFCWKTPGAEANRPLQILHNTYQLDLYQDPSVDWKSEFQVNELVYQAIGGLSFDGVTRTLGVEAYANFVNGCPKCWVSGESWTYNDFRESFATMFRYQLCFPDLISDLERHDLKKSTFECRLAIVREFLAHF